MNTKLLLACAAIAAAASASADLTVQLGTTRVDSAYTNTIVAVPYTDFGGGDITVSNIVKTANLTKGDMCYVLKDNKTSYDAWVLDKDSNDVLYWKPTKVYTVSAGKLTETETDASVTTLAPGSALWIVRKGDVTQPFYLWGTYTGSAASSWVTAGTTNAPVYNLIANTGASDKSITALITNPGDRDEIRIPCNGIKKCIYANKKWNYNTDAVVKPGMGVWYISKGGSGEVIWSDGL